MLVDTHCHLTDKRLNQEVGAVIERAKTAGVEKIIVPSTSLEDARQAVEIASRFEGVYALVGIHPEQVEEITDFETQILKLKELIDMGSRLRGNDKKVVGVGEIGLDFYYDKEKKTKNKQIKLFKKQLEMAVELELPVVIHSRDAKKEMKGVLENVKKLPKGVFHCWGGDENFLKNVFAKGFYVSFCGNVTYEPRRSLQTAEGSEQLFKKTGSEPSCARSASATPGRPPLRDLLKLVPLDRLLLETDSPYLSPEPLRGRLNEPKNVKITAEFIASILKLDLDTLINQTGKNSLCLFHLGS